MESLKKKANILSRTENIEVKIGSVHVNETLRYVRVIIIVVEMQ